MRSAGISHSALSRSISDQVALPLHLAQHSQEVRRAKLGNGPAAKIRKGQGLQTPDDLPGMVGRPARQLLLVPFPRHHFKGQALGEGFRLGCLACGTGVYAAGDHFLCRDRPGPRLLEGNGRIGADGKETFLPLKAVLEPPELAAAWVDQHIQPVTIRHLVGLFLGLRRPDGGIRQLLGHWGYS